MRKQQISDMTKQQLAKALFSFMCIKPLDKISVTEVAECCDVPRSTFYYHFEDIYDLASWALSMKLLECLGEGGTCFLWGDGLKELFRCCHENYDICRCAVRGNDVWRMADSFCDRCMDGIMKGMREFDGDRGTDERFLRYLGLFYGHAVLATLIAWFRGDMAEPYEKITAVIDFMVKDGMDSALNNVQNNPEILEALRDGDSSMPCRAPLLVR